MTLKFQPTGFAGIEIIFGEGHDHVTLFQDSDAIIIDNADLPRLIHELQIIQEGK